MGRPRSAGLSSPADAAGSVRGRLRRAEQWAQVPRALGHGGGLQRARRWPTPAPKQASGAGAPVGWCPPPVVGPVVGPATQPAPAWV